ncbi:MAG TPA: RluA family pseudouridine synthase [Candidatus Saccharimonadales bacterium]|nr:RluA family pseudouridine synthase [Candidatus Saccharimonadales bacterium]
MPVYEIAEDVKSRLDLFIGSKLPQLSRSFIQKLCEDGTVLVNGKTSRPGYRLKKSDKVSLDYDISDMPPIPEIDIPIIYEDDDTIVIDKPAGILSHPVSSSNSEPSVASFIKQRDLKLDGDRAGIVHRLDRPTSGVMITAKNTESLKWLQKQFSSRIVAKTYLAVVSGHPEKPEAIIEMPIARSLKKARLFETSNVGKDAVTYYKVIKQSPNYSMLRVEPKTGRTHQIRVHLAKLGHPIVGDDIYGGKPADRLYLHANSLEIKLPPKDQKQFEAKTPDSFYNLIADDK